MYPSVVMPPAAYKFRPCHLSSPRRGEGFCGTSTYSLHPSLCANSFISPSAINSSFCDALCTLFVSPLMCFHPTYSAMYPTILFCHVSYQTKERLDSCIFCWSVYPRAGSLSLNCLFSLCHMLRPSTKLLSVSRLIHAFYPWCDSWLPYSFSASRITYH